MTTDLTRRARPQDVIVWLTARRPAEVDRGLVSRASSLSVELRVRYEGRYPTGQNGERLPSDSVPTDCEVDGSSEHFDELARLLQDASTPAPSCVIEEWLAEVDVLVPCRQSTEFDDRLRLSVYISRLAAYPADVVREALLGRPWKFWPSWYELHQICERLSGPRHHMLAALEQRVKRAPENQRG